MNWQAVAAGVAGLALLGGYLAVAIRTFAQMKVQGSLLDIHSNGHEIHYAREFETAKNMERALVLLNELEKRVARVESYEHAAR